MRSNDIASMAQRVLNLERGCYVVTYEPPAGTFPTDRRDDYRRIKVRSMRPGVTVRGRSRFYAVADPVLPLPPRSR